MTPGRTSPPLVSVIMPVWRPHPDWLLEAVTSVLSQRGCRLELIVVDDGCDEPVAPLLASVIDGRVRVLRVEHGGQGAALNAGVAAAHGEWLRFADADDVMPPDSTQHLATLMDGDALIAYGSTLVCDATLHPRRAIESNLQGDVVADCLLGRFHARHPSMLFPRRVVQAAGPWDTTFRVSADWDFALRAFEQAPVRGDQDVVTLYRRHSRSVSRSADVTAGEDARRRIITGYFLRHPEQAGSELERQAWVALYIDRGQAYWDAGQYGRAVDRLARAVRRAPLSGANQLARLAGHRVRRRLHVRPAASHHS